tara:strand:- start:59 stop:877 length:819 start_codon:yes stop_codon:yes gene_type:complete
VPVFFNNILNDLEDMTPLWEYAFLFGIGLIAGFVNVLAGGGSMITVPVMVFLGLPGHIANGTNRIAILVQNLVAVVTFFRRGLSDFKLSLLLLACTLPGAVVGALAGTQLRGAWFNRTLAVVMVLLLIFMWAKKGLKPKADLASPAVEPKGKRLLWGCVLMIGIGFYGGFIQIGVSLMLMPLLNRVLGIDLVRVNMHKVFIIFGYTIFALSIYAWRLDIRWLLGCALALGNGIGGWAGATMSVQKGERLIRILLNVALVAFIIKLLLFSAVD